MKITRVKKIVSGVVLCSLMAGLAYADTYRYRLSGDYFTVTDGTSEGWYLNSDPNGTPGPGLPGSNDTIRCNYGNNTVTLTNATAPNVGALQFGVDESGGMVVGDGGSLTANGNSKIGNNNNCTGFLTVNTNGYVAANGGWLMVAGSSLVSGIVTLNGGELDIAGHLWCATGAGSHAQININSGTLSVGQNIGLGTIAPAVLSNTGGTAQINVNGGVLALSIIHADLGTGNSIRDGSYINIALTGKVTIPGDRSLVMSNYVAAGSILGYGLTNNVNIEVVIDPPGTTNTVLTAVNAAVPDLTGMDLTTVTNTLTLFGFTVGSVSTGYLWGATFETVISQDPIAGETALPGTPVDLVIMEPMAATETLNYCNVADGNWADTNSWNTLVVPERETQNFQVIGNAGYAIDLTNQVACARFMWAANGNPAILNVQAGGHLKTGWTQWTAIGYDGKATVNVYSGGVFESIRECLFAWNTSGPQESSINIDGGTFIANGWIALGQAPNFGTITVTNGGVLNVERFHGTATNGVVNVYDGTMSFNGNRVAEMQANIAAGLIAVAPGYSYTIVYADAKTTLTSFLPGYASWAASYLPAVIGAEGDDFDSDDRNNFYEYVLNGNPTNALDKGVDPVLTDVGGVLEYVYVKRADDTNLVYSVQTKTNLVSGVWADSGFTVTGTNVTGEAYDEVTNSISTAPGQTFIHLKIENN